MAPGIIPPRVPVTALLQISVSGYTFFAVAVGSRTRPKRFNMAAAETDCKSSEPCCADTSSSCDPHHSSHAPDGGKPSSFVIVHSVSKRHNIGTIARCATAFGVKEVCHCHERVSEARMRQRLDCHAPMQVCLVGSRQFNTFGSHGSDAYVNFRHDHTLEDCVRRLKEKDKCLIVGVEIVDGARAINSHPFQGGIFLIRTPMKDHCYVRFL